MKMQFGLAPYLILVAQFGAALPSSGQTEQPRTARDWIALCDARAENRQFDFSGSGGGSRWGIRSRFESCSVAHGSLWVAKRKRPAYLGRALSGDFSVRRSNARRGELPFNPAPLSPLRLLSRIRYSRLGSFP